MYNFNDPISDMIVRILNGQSKELELIFIYFSNINFFILNILQEEGYILNFCKVKIKFKYYIKILLKYYNDKPVIQIFKRISKLGLRIYRKYKFIPRIMNGLGICILSTNKGVISDKTARKIHQGGELLCYVF